MNKKQLNCNFPRLSDSLLVEAYQKAIDLNLDNDFIDLLKTDLKKRKLSEKEIESHYNSHSFSSNQINVCKNSH